MCIVILFYVERLDLLAAPDPGICYGGGGGGGGGAVYQRGGNVCEAV